MQAGIAGLARDKTRPARIPPLPAATVDHVVAMTNQALPHEATHWTASAMAQATWISPSSVRRIWTAGTDCNRIGCGRSSSPTIPNRCQAQGGCRSIYRSAGSCRGPQHRRESQIQALDRTPPGLPMKKGRCATMTHDYKRNGTTTLFAALNILDGTTRALHAAPPASGIHPFSQHCRARGRGRQGGPCGPRQLRHSQASQGESLARSPSRVTFHFTPTSCSWANAVEGWSLNSPDNGSSAASSPRSSSCRPPSTASSPMPTSPPSRSSGPNPPMPSSPPSTAGDKR